jgi:hypothetical protein
MMRAPRISPLARPISLSMPDTSPERRPLAIVGPALSIDD